MHRAPYVVKDKGAVVRAGVALDSDKVVRLPAGTAVVVAPVGSVEYKGKTVKFCDGKVGPTSQAMYDELTGIQQGKLPDERGWNVKVPKFPISG